MTTEEFEALPKPKATSLQGLAVQRMKSGEVIVLKHEEAVCKSLGECSIRDMLTMVRRDNNTDGDTRSFKDHHLDDGTVAVACFTKEP